MSEITSYPLSWPIGWPRTKKPVRSRFGSGQNTPSVDKATRFLQEEIQRLNGQRISERYVNNYTLSSNLKLRQDGNPYSVQPRTDDHGVACYFKYNGEDMVIACDTFDREGCNIYSIAKTIEAMRSIDRWGCSELLKRAFTGFKAIAEKASQSTWFTVLALNENATKEEIKERYRMLVKQVHPDNQETGDAEKFIQINGAYEDAMRKFN